MVRTSRFAASPLRRGGVVRPGRVVGITALSGGVLFGAMGGEYSSIDYWKLSRLVVGEESALQGLQAEIDSLGPYADSIETNPTVQERVAREKFGMLRDGETVYMVGSARDDSESKRR